jgi:thiol-disulfide isomerase/thioredoxin
VSTHTPETPGASPPRRWLRTAAIAAAGAIALAIGLYFGGGIPEWGSADVRGKDAGALFGVALPDAAGSEQPLAQWKGKVVVVNFWATWCVPCREEMPEFVKAQAELGGRGLQFVGIAIDEPAKVQAFATELGLNYPALIGGYGAIELSKTLGNRLGALPFTVVIDRNGRYVHTQLGPLKEARLRAIIDQLL